MLPFYAKSLILTFLNFDAFKSSLPRGEGGVVASIHSQSFNRKYIEPNLQTRSISEEGLKAHS